MFQSGWKQLHSLTMNVRVSLFFLKKNIFSWFGTPQAIISDGGSHFCNRLFSVMLVKYGVKHKVATAHHL